MPRFCTNCGKMVSEDSSFCMECGDPLKLTKQTSSVSQDIKNDLTWVIIFSIFYAVFTIGLQLFRIIGGFLTITAYDPGLDYHYKIHFYYNTVTEVIFGFPLNVSYNFYHNNSPFLKLDMIWELLPLTGITWFITTIVAAILIFATAYNIYNNKAVKTRFNLPKIAIIIGLLSNIIEYGLFIILLVGENWLPDEIPQINFLYLFFYILGNIALILAYLKISRYSHLYLTSKS